MVDARYRSEIDETAHTVLYSWRYNPKGEFGVLYLSSSPDCAWREKLRQVHGRAEDLPPQAVGTFSVDLSRCLDLTNPQSRRQLDLSLETITQPNDFTTTQSLAREARLLGFEAIVAPSAAGEPCHSLVVFKDKLAPPAYCLCNLDSIVPHPRGP